MNTDRHRFGSNCGEFAKVRLDSIPVEFDGFEKADGVFA